MSNQPPIPGNPYLEPDASPDFAGFSDVPGELTDGEVKALTSSVTAHVEMLAESGIAGPVDDRWFRLALQHAVDKVFEAHGQPTGTAVAREIITEAFAAITAVTLVAIPMKAKSNMTGPPMLMPETDAIQAFEAEVQKYRSQADSF